MQEEAKKTHAYKEVTLKDLHKWVQKPCTQKSWSPQPNRFVIIRDLCDLSASKAMDHRHGGPRLDE